MLKENWRTISRLERICDILLVIASFWVAYYGRSSLLFWDEAFQLQIPFAGRNLAPIKDYYIVLIVSLIGFSLMLQWLGAYDSMRLRSSFEIFWISLVSSIAVFLLLSATLFLLKIDLSRSFIALFCILVCLSLAAERAIVLEILRFWRKRGRNYRRIIIAGLGHQARQLATEITTRPELGIRIRAFCDLKPDTTSTEENYQKFREKLTAIGYAPKVGRILKGIDQLDSALREYAIDEVIFTDYRAAVLEVQEMLERCAEQGVRTTIAADLFSAGISRSRMSFFGEMPLIHFETPPGDRWDLSLKRFLDVVLSALLLIILFPLFIAIALIIKLTSRGSVFFIQTRVGQNGHLFPLYKFRSMIDGAELKQQELEAYNEMAGPVFKMKNDPRITKFGSFLRRFSLDELPQLWNVFVGDMSLVGPRPPVPGEVNLYERSDRRRLSMRPGLTCTWQVSGRSDINDFERWVSMDLEYIDNWSLGRDLILLIRTIPAVIFARGAR